MIFLFRTKVCWYKSDIDNMKFISFIRRQRGKGLTTKVPVERDLNLGERILPKNYQGGFNYEN